MATTRRRRYYTTPTRRIKIFPGIYINVGSRGESLSFGNKAAKATVGKTGTNYTVGIPGTGLSYRKKISNKSKDNGNKSWISWIVTIGVALLGIFSNRQSSTKEVDSHISKKKSTKKK